MKRLSLPALAAAAVLTALAASLLLAGSSQADHGAIQHWPSVRMEWNYGATGGAKFGTMSKATAWAVPNAWRSIVNAAATDWKNATGLEIVGPVTLQNHQVQGETYPKGVEVYFQRRSIGVYDRYGCDDSTQNPEEIAVGCAVRLETALGSLITGSVVVLLIERNYDKGLYPAESGEEYWPHEGWQLTTDCTASKPSTGAKGRFHVQEVASHEFGHAWGHQEHLTRRKHITDPMYYAIDVYHPARAPHSATNRRGRNWGCPFTPSARGVSARNLVRLYDFQANASGTRSDIRPPAPANVVATAIGSGSIKVAWEWQQQSGRWTADSFGVKYRRKAKAGNTPPRWQAVYVKDAKSYTITGLRLDKAKELKVSAQGPKAIRKTMYQDSAVIIVPPMPTGLTGRGGSGSAILDWNDVDHAAAYEVQQWDGRALSWRTLPFRESHLTHDYTITFSGSGATISGLPKGVSYGHRVRSKNGSGFSEWTDYITTAVPAEGLSGQEGGEPANPTPEPPKPEPPKKEDR